MFSDSNKILIKDKGGQFKTVSLSDDKKQTVPQKPIMKKEDKQPVQQTQPVKPIIKEKKEVNQLVVPVQPPVKKDPPKKESKVPSFYFDVKDEEEVAKFKNKDNEGVRQKKEEMLKREAQRFMKMIPRDLPAEQQVKFEKILVSYLRGVRTELEVGEILVRESGKGGFGFEREEVRKFIKELKNKKIFFEGLTLDKIKELKKVDDKKEEIPKPEVMKAPQEIKEKEKLEFYPPKSSRVVRSEGGKNKAPKVQEIVSPQNKQQDFEKRARIKKPTQQPIFNAQQKKTQGPIDELLSLTLEEFRSFGSSAKERVNKIYEKINLLEEESIEKKNQGIISWKSSSVYKEYVAVGEESLSKGISVEEAVDKNGKISIDEFNSIADLNEQLNY